MLYIDNADGPLAALRRAQAIAAAQRASAAAEAQAEARARAQAQAQAQAAARAAAKSPALQPICGSNTQDLVRAQALALMQADGKVRAAQAALAQLGPTSSFAVAGTLSMPVPPMIASPAYNEKRQKAQSDLVSALHDRQNLAAQLNAEFKPAPAPAPAPPPKHHGSFLGNLVKDVGDGLEIAGGEMLTDTGVGAPLGVLIMADGTQRLVHDVHDQVTGQSTDGYLSRALQSNVAKNDLGIHLSQDAANRIDLGTNAVLSLAAAGPGLAKVSTLAVTGFRAAPTLVNGTKAAAAATSVFLMGDSTYAQAHYVATGRSQNSLATTALEGAGLSPDAAGAVQLVGGMGVGVLGPRMMPVTRDEGAGVIPQARLAALVETTNPPAALFVKAPILGYRFANGDLSDVPAFIRSKLGSVDQTAYSPEYLRDNAGSAIALQATDKGADFYIIGGVKLTNGYRTVPIPDVLADNAAMIDKLRAVDGMGDLISSADPNVIGLLRTAPTEMIRTSDVGFPAAEQITLQSPWGEQTKPAGADGYLVRDGDTEQYYLVNEEAGRPIGYVPSP